MGAWIGILLLFGLAAFIAFILSIVHASSKNSLSAEGHVIYYDVCIAVMTLLSLNSNPRIVTIVAVVCGLTLFGIHYYLRSPPSPGKQSINEILAWFRAAGENPLKRAAKGELVLEEQPEIFTYQNFLTLISMIGLSLFLLLFGAPQYGILLIIIGVTVVSFYYRSAYNRIAERKTENLSILSGRWGITHPSVLVRQYATECNIDPSVLRPIEQLYTEVFNDFTNIDLTHTMELRRLHEIQEEYDGNVRSDEFYPAANLIDNTYRNLMSLLGQYAEIARDVANNVSDDYITYEGRDDDPIKTIQEQLNDLVPRKFPFDIPVRSVTPEDICRWSGFTGVFERNRLALPHDTRFEHQFVLAPTGSGKTTLLQTQIVGDFDKVASGEASIIVLDGENELIPALAKLAVFAPGGELEGRLVVLEPEAEYPLALNIFNVGKLSGTEEQQIEAQKDAIENVSYCLATMNELQDDMLSYLVEFCLVIPDATIRTIMELLEPDWLKLHGKYLPKLDDIARGYFATTFKDDGTRPTKTAVLRRLQGMMRNPMFRRMFESGETKFDMSTHIEAGKVILINTKRRLMGANGCQMFGRFFISQLMQAAIYRESTSRSVFCYVDECQDYISNDQQIGAFLLKARKRRIGMIFATQDITFIEGTRVRSALQGLAIRFVAPEGVRERGRFSCFIRYVTDDDNPVGVQVPPGVLQRMDRMSDGQHAVMKDHMREKFCRQAKVPNEDSVVARQTAVVVPLWTRIQRTAIAAGISIDGENDKVDFGLLAQRLTQEQIDDFHTLRLQRNKLVHHLHPIPDFEWWEERAREIHAALMNTPPSDDDRTQRRNPTL